MRLVWRGWGEGERMVWGVGGVEREGGREEQGGGGGKQKEGREGGGEEGEGWVIGGGGGEGPGRSHSNCASVVLLSSDCGWSLRRFGKSFAKSSKAVIGT